MITEEPPEPSNVFSYQPKSFRVMARLISEIGDELISSDAIALYELIKNAYDASSTYALLELKTPIVSTDIDQAVNEAQVLWDSNSLTPKAINSLLEKVETLTKPVGAIERLKEALQSYKADDWRMALQREYRRASQIIIEDSGHGMDRETLENAFLTVGTPMRRLERQHRRRVLGEKGVGRFSTKRLGQFLRVETSTGKEGQQHILEINWNQYATDSTLLLDEVSNPLWSIPNTKAKAGTRLIISDLNNVWSSASLVDITENHLSKLMNPFFPESFKIISRINGEKIDLAELYDGVLRIARLHIKGRIDPLSTTPLTYNIVYEGETQIPAVKPLDRRFESSLADLRHVGPFDFEIYEFDRTDTSLGKTGRKTVIGDFLDRWGGGGPMLFRDGFRVMPYGQPGNDWLEIDRMFFQQRGGSRLRTVAMTGYVSISADQNPYLIDQTNREGLRENEAYKTFRNTLVNMINIINIEYKHLKPSVSTSDKLASIETFTKAKNKLSRSSRATVKALTALHAVLQGTQIPYQESFDRVLIAVNHLEKHAQSYEDIGLRLQKQLDLEITRNHTLLELAGLGMTAEQVFHELNSLLDRIHNLLDRLTKLLQLPTERAILNQIAANLKSVRQISRFLDPFTQTGRRQRTILDVAEEISDVALHYPELQSGRVHLEIITDTDHGHLRVRTNRGLLLQVFDNLIGNSLYWLGQNPIPTNPTIRAILNVSNGSIITEDNGPGIDPDFAQDIFHPFVSAKPMGRGLGLFIVKELLALEGCTISLLPDRNSADRLYRFEINLKNLIYLP